MSANRLEMHNISLAFSGFQALNKVDFTLHGGSVHALTGANGAGKSTLMAVLCGTHAHYQGEVTINDQPVTIRSPRDAKQLGIHLVQQEVDVALVPGLSIAENIMLDRLAEPGMAFRWSRVRQLAREALAQLDVALDVRRSIDSCTLAEKQQILLARALSHHCRFLILDEPTAPLDQHESERLFAVVRRLQQQGIGVVFISHRIHELKAICDTLTVLRDGRLIESGPMAPLSGEQIVEKMLGHELSDIFPPPRPPHGKRCCCRLTVCMMRRCCRIFRCVCGRGNSGYRRAGRRGQNRAVQSAVRRQQKPGAAWRAERPAVATARSCRLGGARPGAGPGGAAQRGHFHRRADRDEPGGQRR